MVHSGVLYISERQRGPKRRGFGEANSPYPTLSTGLQLQAIKWWQNGTVHREVTSVLGWGSRGSVQFLGCRKIVKKSYSFVCICTIRDWKAKR